MSHPARAPRRGIDGQANGTRRRHDGMVSWHTLEEAAL